MNTLKAMTAVILLVATAPALAGRLEGHGRFEKIKGKPNMGYLELYECNLYASPSGPVVTGPSRRLGTTCVSGGVCVQPNLTHDGCYCVDPLTAGVYSVVVNQPLFFVAPKVIPQVEVPTSGNVVVNVDLGLDFSTYFKTDWVMSAESTWYQTFVATGSGIRGVAFSYAGDSPSYIDVAVLRDNGNPDVRSWPVVAQRTDGSVSDVTDNWVRFRSSECPTTPGVRYAVRLSAVGHNIQPYKRNKDSGSYVGGRAYNSAGAAQSFDINVTVFSDNDGTSVTMNKRTEGIGDLQDGNFSGRWGQSFVARGSSLAAVDVWAAGAEHKWNLDFAWKIYPAGPAGPSGPQIGPTKTTQAAYQSFGEGLHAVSYIPNEVRLTPGQTYMVEFTIVNPPPESNGFNPNVMTDDSYADGMGFFWAPGGWIPRPEIDLAMTIVEYTPPGPTIFASPASVQAEAYVGGEAHEGSFSVVNAGGGTLTYAVASDAPWMSAWPLSGDSTGEADPIAIVYDTAALPVGTRTGHLTVNSAQAGVAPAMITVTLTVRNIPADFDHDRDVDMSDYSRLQRCYSGAGVVQTRPECGPTDLDGDADMDGDDLERFMACFSGPNIFAQAACVP